MTIEFQNQDGVGLANSHSLDTFMTISKIPKVPKKYLKLRPFSILHRKYYPKIYKKDIGFDLG